MACFFLICGYEGRRAFLVTSTALILAEVKEELVKQADRSTEATALKLVT